MKVCFQIGHLYDMGEGKGGGGGGGVPLSLYNMSYTDVIKIFVLHCIVLFNSYYIIILPHNITHGCVMAGFVLWYG